VIGKVIRGNNARGLLHYLYSPGRACEHVNPHLIAGFTDPDYLEPGRRPGGGRDFRLLAGLLAQPLAALVGPGYERPVWHCSLRAAPGDRELSDQEWARVAALVMDRTGLAPTDDDLGVRWVAVRHAADHVHIVATLGRQDGARPRVWNDFYRVREACQQAERDLGLRATAPADRTAARRPARSETEQAARRRWREAPRVRLRREVTAAAAGAGSEREFFARLSQAGVLVRRRRSSQDPAQVTGYSVGFAEHAARDGGVVWYGGGKLAADLTLPKLRKRWTGQGGGLAGGPGLSEAAVRGVLRRAVTGAAEAAGDEAGFFAGLRAAGVGVRLRFSEADPGQVTGYAVSLPGRAGPGGAPAWYGGGRLAAGLTLPRLRRRWAGEGSGGPDRSGTFRFTAAERNAIFEHAARQAGMAAEHIGRHAAGDPGGAADAAWAAADALCMAARATGSPQLRRAAESFDRAARAPHGRTPEPTGAGRTLRDTARLLAIVGAPAGPTLLSAVLAAGLVTLILAVAELRQAQQNAAQAQAAQAAAGHLHAGPIADRPRRTPAQTTAAAGHDRDSAAGPAPGDFPPGLVLVRPAPDAGVTAGRPSPRPRAAPPRRSGPAP
jgi:hypothetical protein